MAKGILHDENADIADIQIDIVAGIESCTGS
jgi:hypothetical protein